MDERATGIILRTRPLTETSVIVHWLTSDLGRLATVAKGARRAQSPFRGKLDLFYVAEFSFARSRRSDLHIAREVVLRETHPELRRDLARLEQASYCAALIEQTTEPESPLPAIFGLLHGLLGHLAQSQAEPRTVMAFELKLLTELGLRPDFESSAITPGTKMLLKRLIETDWIRLSRLKFSEVQTVEARNFLHGFLAHHLGKVLPARSAALRKE
jgi:DNA repair protein RecO (recombination protein O)